jgi:hypothetical protein
VSGSVHTPVARCADAAPPCFQIVENPACILDPAHAQLLFEPGASPPPAGSQIVVGCP